MNDIAPPQRQSTGSGDHDRDGAVEGNYVGNTADSGEVDLASEVASSDRNDDSSGEGVYSGREDQLAKYEWMGGIAAGLGIFLTPLIAGPVAGYFAYLLWDEKPRSAILIISGVFITVVVWWLLLLSIIIN